jgi:membrane-associated protease RseP (regulator of RpoE activity)
MMLYKHPVAFAAWAGLLLTTLNLMPFSQLDGGHVFYAMLGRRSVLIVHCLFVAAIIATAWFNLWHWSLFLILIALLGISHPPTANDAVPLKPFRHCLGWTTLLFVFIGFAPSPINPDDFKPEQKPVWYCLETEPQRHSPCSIGVSC